MNATRKTALFRSFFAAATAALALVAAPAAANTTSLGSTKIDDTADSRSTCQTPLVEHPFARFGDDRDYVLAPGGAFEGLAPGWQLSGKAGVVNGNEAFFVHSQQDTRSLSLSPGAAAITPAFCLDLTYPSFRFATKAMTDPGAAQLRVEVVYPDVPRPEWADVIEFDGKQGNHAKTGWRVSQDVELKPDFGGDAAGERRAALRITAVRGTWRVDDLYLDPRRH